MRYKKEKNIKEVLENYKHNVKQSNILFKLHNLQKKIVSVWIIGFNIFNYPLIQTDHVFININTVWHLVSEKYVFL